MGSFYKHHKSIKAKFNKLIVEYKKLFFYGSAVDEWLPEIVIMPFITLPWKCDPTWYRVIAPPGSGKTQHFNMLKGYKHAYIVDEITSKAFISGYRIEGGGDMSMMPQINNKVLVICDESTMMEQRPEERSQVQSLLRRAYDGNLAKKFGNKEDMQEYDCSFNILVGSTPAIDRYFLYNQALGERYINYRAQISDRRALTKKAFNNLFVEDFQKHCNIVAKKTQKFIDEIPDTTLNDITIEDKHIELFINCADFIALLRTHVNRDKSGRDVTTLPQPESAGRLVKQMTQTAIANAILHGNMIVTDDNVERAIYLGIGSVMALTSFLLYHIKDLISIGGGPNMSWFTTGEMVAKTGIGRGTLGTVIEDMAIHRILTCREGRRRGSRVYEYQLTESALNVIESTKLFKNYSPPCKEIIAIKRADRSNLERVKKIAKSKNRKLKRVCTAKPYNTKSKLVQQDQLDQNMRKPTVKRRGKQKQGLKKLKKPIS